MIYQNKPAFIEAIQWTEDNYTELYEVFGDKVLLKAGTGELLIEAGKNGAQGWVPVPINHFIVRMVDDNSDIWPVDSEYFRIKYEKIDE